MLGGRHVTEKSLPQAFQAASGISFAKNLSTAARKTARGKLRNRLPALLQLQIAPTGAHSLFGAGTIRLC